MVEMAVKSRPKLIENLGSLFLAIIIYIISCETFRYGFIKFNNCPDTVCLYLCQGCCILIIPLSLATIIFAISMVVNLFFSATENVVSSCVEYIYINGKKSYNWWETKSAITFLVTVNLMILWAIFSIQSIDFMIGSWDWNNLGKDRFIIYRMVGFLIYFLCSFAGFLQITGINNC